MGDKFKNETSCQNYEWHRERTLREKENPNAHSAARVDWNLRQIEKRHGQKAAREMVKEFNRTNPKKKFYFT